MSDHMTEAVAAMRSSYAPDVQDERWYESAADLLAEDDPGPTPFLVDELVVEGAIAAFVGAAKNGKTWTLLELAVAIVTGEPAFGRFTVPKPGPVLVILEESGRAALHRRLDMLARGRTLPPERFVEFCFAANRRVRLNEMEWQQRLHEAVQAQAWRLIAFDPLVRVKGATVDENVQREIGPVLDFIRDLRDASNGAAVGYSHHTPHDGTRQRGSSDLEAYWESKVTVARKDGQRTLRAEHREAESSAEYRLSFGFDMTTRTVRPGAFRDELEERVRAYLSEHPDASANDVSNSIGGTRSKVLDLVKQLREGGTEPAVPPRTTASGSDGGGGTAGGAYKAPRTTPLTEDAEVVPEPPYHPSVGRCIQCGAPTVPGSLYCVADGGAHHHHDADDASAEGSTR